MDKEKAFEYHDAIVLGNEAVSWLSEDEDVTEIKPDTSRKKKRKLKTKNPRPTPRVFVEKTEVVNDDGYILTVLVKTVKKFYDKSLKRLINSKWKNHYDRSSIEKLAEESKGSEVHTG
jgi:hypothetical protein